MNEPASLTQIAGTGSTKCHSSGSPRLSISLTQSLITRKALMLDAKARDLLTGLSECSIKVLLRETYSW